MSNYRFQKRYWNDGGNDSSSGGEYVAMFNELHKETADILIENDPIAYYSSLPEEYKLYQRDSVQVIGDPVILDKQKDILSSIKDILLSHDTDYRVIISPLYDQVKLNPLDSMFLTNLFSPQRFYDFSGINEFTADSLNYYENSHYRPSLCKELLRIIYQ